MRDERWIEVEADFQSAVRYFEKARKLYALGTSARDDEQEDTYALAFMHAMQAGHTSLESGLVRIMKMVDEVPPEGDGWHADLAKRMSEPIEGKRPAFFAPDLARAADLPRRFRHVAARTYDDFNWEDARRPVEAAQVVVSSLMRAFEGFREGLDPAQGEDGPGGPRKSSRS